MAPTSRTLVLLGLLVASFCVSANAGRDLAETSKLDLGALGSVTGVLAGLKVDRINVNLVIDLSSVLSPLAIAVENVAGENVELTVVTGIVNKLKTPITISVTAERLLTITVAINGEERTIDVPLASVVTAVTNVLTPVLTVVLTLVETITGNESVVTLTNQVGETITVITTTVTTVTGALP